MRAAISVIIPVKDSAAALPALFEGLMEGVQAGLIREVVISDGGSTDGTLELAEAAGAQIVTGPPSRGGQLRRGVAASGGEWLLVLHADSGLPPGWAEAVQAHLSHPDQAAYFDLRFRARGLAPWGVAGWANLRSRWFGLPYGDQGLLIARTLYDRVGGYPDQPLMEDVALARALRGAWRPLGVAISTSAERYQRDGWLRRGARNLSILLRYLMGADPVVLARAYQRRR